MPDGALAAARPADGRRGRARDADQRAANPGEAPGFAARIDELRAVFGADCRVFALDTEGGSTPLGGAGVVAQTGRARRRGAGERAAQAWEAAEGDAMRYLSLFDGIGAVHVAWQPLGGSALAPPRSRRSLPVWSRSGGVRQPRRRDQDHRRTDCGARPYRPRCRRLAVSGLERRREAGGGRRAVRVVSPSTTDIPCSSNLLRRPIPALGERPRRVQHARGQRLLLSWLARWQDAASMRPSMDGDRRRGGGSSGEPSSGPCLTRSGSEWRSGGVACSALLDVGNLARSTADTSGSRPPARDSAPRREAGKELPQPCGAH